jgi:hypothetical protein
MEKIKYPSLYQINTRVWLTELSQKLGRQATLDDIPDTELNRLAYLGFDWIYLLSVWSTGEKGKKISQGNPEWRRDFESTLPDLQKKDIAGSGFAIANYAVPTEIGGNAVLKRLRAKLHKRNMKLMLDFVPNHMGPDHPWVQDHPNLFIQGTERNFENSPEIYTRIKIWSGYLVFAYGRDPNFVGWPDTIQLDYSNPATVKAMSKELLRISGQCDGVRCDMAMLVLPEVFERTWGKKALPFWPVVTRAVRKKYPDFCFMAEVYWDMEWQMLQQGFDFAYDKRLYDRLCENHARPVYEHLLAGVDYQNKLARFLENHDEPRAASTFEPDKHKAAAIITYFSPGLRFFHHGQLGGKKKRISPHLIRGPKEPVIPELKAFYEEFLSILKKPVFREGSWQLLDGVPTWSGNETNTSFLNFFWTGTTGEQILVTVNYAPHQSECYLHLPALNANGPIVRFADLMSQAVYDRDAIDLLTTGLYLDMPAWGYHIFEISSR